MKRVLVTGASGFIGGALSKYLEETTDWEVHKAGRSLPREERCHHQDLTNPRSVGSLMAKVKPHTIFHLAANPSTRPVTGDINGIIRSNVDMTHNLCYHCPKMCRFIYASSVLVYGDSQHVWFERSRPSPTSVYGATKLASEAIVDAYTSQREIVGSSLRLCATVGPTTDHGIVYDFIQKLSTKDSHLEALGVEPGTKKPFIHIDDVCSAFKWLATNLFLGPFNLTAHNSLTVAGVASAVMQAMGVHKPIRWLGQGATWKGDNAYINVDCSHIKDLGFKFRTQDSFTAIKYAVKEHLECSKSMD